MCGIACLVSSHPNIQKMLDNMTNRGPDDQGVFVDGDTQLGMVRLAIQDVSQAGHQPMTSVNGRYVIVYNGEVYNFQQLREKYLSDVNLKSNSDTEVLLALYEKLGVDCLQHFRGMFAFLIWDKEEKTIFGARDRMGIKPMLYYHNNNQLAISSELKSILASGITPKEINKTAVEDLFLYGSVQFPKTFIKGINSIPPANYFTYKNNTLEIKPYWSFPTTTNNAITFEQAVENFKEEYKEAIKLRLISDRKVGIFLSSGIDSVSILANLKQLGINNVQTFTIGFKNDKTRFFDESKSATALAKHFGFEPIVEYVEPEDVKNDFDEFIIGLDQPSIDGLNTFLVSKLSKKHLTVALSGLGGDELLMGYPRDLNAYNFLNRGFKTGILSDAITGKFITDVSPLIGKLNRVSNMLGSSNNTNLHYLAGRFITSPQQVAGIVNRFSQTTTPSLLDNYFKYQTFSNLSLANTITANTLRSYTLSQLLRDMDVVSMSQSIEVRFPLLDHKLIEFIMSLPPEYRFRANNSTKNKTGTLPYSESGMKRLLIEAYKNELPEGYLSTPKQGFQLPIYNWLEEFITPDMLGELMEQKGIKELFNSNWLKSQLEYYKTNRTITNQLYLFIVFAKWYKSIYS